MPTYVPSRRHSRKIAAALIAATAFWGWLCGAAEPSGSKPPDASASAKKQLADLLAEYNDGFEKIREEMVRTMPADEVNDTIMSTGPLERLGYLGPRFLEIARENPKTDVSWKALTWVAYIRGFSHENKAAALQQMLRDHISDDEFYDDLYFHLYRPGVDKERFYRAVLERRYAPRRVAGMARFALGEWLVKVRKGAEAEVEAVRLFEQVQADYSDLPHHYDPERGTLGDAAERAQFEIEHLQVGKVAPEIVGEDVDGEQFALSDYGGKVVLLVFCGDWCGPCRSLYPHEKELAERLRDRPFAIVGVNSDEPDALRRAIDRERFSFRWFADGGTRGPISQRWNVESWPMLYVMDQEGIIRLKRVGAQRPEEIDELIERLLADP